MQDSFSGVQMLVATKKETKMDGKAVFCRCDGGLLALARSYGSFRAKNANRNNYFYYFMVGRREGTQKYVVDFFLHFSSKKGMFLGLGYRDVVG